MRLLSCLTACAVAFSLSSCAANGDASIASSSGASLANAVAEGVSEREPIWAFEASDVPVDPAFRFGVLDNGMRFVLRENATPEGTALVRLHIESGSLDEMESERGLAHFLEHMAFNGSTRVPEGEMVRLLEREGLAFGADTNASTGIETTTYKLNLPRNNPELLDTALMLMRETASELTIAQDAVERERGVILSEQRDRMNFSYKEMIDRFAFTAPDARFTQRLPIGQTEILKTASADDLRGYYERNYVPENTVLMIVGDFPLALMEERIVHWFADWSGAADPAEQSTGPIDIERSGETSIYVDPALTEQLSIFSLGRWQDRPDTIANRQQAILRQVGYRIINRRMQALARSEDAPFKSAGFGSSDVFEDARSTNLSINTENGKWRAGLEAAAYSLRQSLQYGFSDAEIAEQVARIRTSLENGVSAADTRTNSALFSAALQLVSYDRIPSTPASSLARFEAFAPSITAEAAWNAVLADISGLDDPMIRFQGREAPDGAAQALRDAWNSAMALAIEAPSFTDATAFAYNDFGAPGVIVSDTVDDRFDFRLIRFANGVRLTLKQTDISKDRVRYRVSIDGGQLLNTRGNPLATGLATSLPSGGLGKHSQDELQTVLAGRSVGLSVDVGSDAFVLGGTTTPRDLDLQMRLIAAGITDPGYRPEGEARFRRSIDDFFASRDATPGNALSNALGGILSDNDPRFTLQDIEAYRALSFAGLADNIGDRLRAGAIEIALVGEFDAGQAIASVAATLGALPTRETDFNLRQEARHRAFTSRRDLVTITHKGEPNQALIRMTWPTADDRDLKQALELAVLARVVRITLQEQLREDLGKSYSPSASSSPSRIYEGYGTFALAASIDLADLDETRAAIRTMLAELRDGAIDEDTLSRARQPLIENYDNLLKTLGGWMTLADRAQSESDRLDRFFRAPVLLKAVSTSDIQRAAQAFLAEEQALEVLVLPETELVAAQ